MRRYPSDIAFTESIKATQAAKGSRDAYARMEAGRGWMTTVTPDRSHQQHYWTESCGPVTVQRREDCDRWRPEATPPPPALDEISLVSGIAGRLAILAEPLEE